MNKMRVIRSTLQGLKLNKNLQHRRTFNHWFKEDHSNLQNLCKDFAVNNLMKHAAIVDKCGIFPKDQIDALGELGMLSVMVSCKWNGSGRDMLSLSLVIEQIARGCASCGMIVAIHNCLYANLLNNRGTPEQKEQFLKPFTKGALGCFALSESDAGSDVGNIQTTACDDGDHWILNGTKTWVTSALESKAAIVFATHDRSLQHKGISCFIVPMGVSGVTVEKSEDKLGIRGTSTCYLHLQGVRIPKSYMIGNKGEGFKLAMGQLDHARIGIASLALGISQAALDCAVHYSMKRIAFGHPLAKISAVQNRISEMALQVESVRLLTHRAAVEITTKNSAMAKFAAGRCATDVADNCIQILGSMGYAVNMPAERHYRDARGTQIFGGVTDVLKMVVAKQIYNEYGYSL